MITDRQRNTLTHDYPPFIASKTLKKYIYTLSSYIYLFFSGKDEEPSTANSSHSWRNIDRSRDFVSKTLTRSRTSAAPCENRFRLSNECLRNPSVKALLFYNEHWHMKAHSACQIWNVNSSFLLFWTVYFFVFVILWHVCFIFMGYGEQIEKWAENGK